MGGVARGPGIWRRRRLAFPTWAGLTLRRHRTTILPHAGASYLVTDGPYRWRRHPIYIADVFLLFGAAELTRNIWFVILAFVFRGAGHPVADHSRGAAPGGEVRRCVAGLCHAHAAVDLTAMAVDYAEKEREFLEGLEADTGRDLAAVDACDCGHGTYRTATRSSIGCASRVFCSRARRGWNGSITMAGGRFIWMRRVRPLVARRRRSPLRPCGRPLLPRQHRLRHRLRLFRRRHPAHPPLSRRRAAPQERRGRDIAR